MPLIEPESRSPGRLLILYNGQNGLNHQAGARFVGTTLPTVAEARITAGLMSDAMLSGLADYMRVTGWRIVDNDGITLYEEPFLSAKIGNGSFPGAASTSQSFSISLVGKGTPEALGIKAGRTATFIFPGYYSPALGVEPRTAIIPGGLGEDLRAFLQSSIDVGADFYGQKAQYADYVNNQFNAHTQKRWGY